MRTMRSELGHSSSFNAQFHAGRVLRWTPPLGGGQSCLHGLSKTRISTTKPPPFFCFYDKGMALPKRRGIAMSKIPNELRTTIAHNIRACRLRQFDGKGAAMQCAAAYSEFSGKKVSPAQWSMWERGKRSPTEERLVHIAAFFSVTVDYLRQNHQPAPAQPPPPVSTPEEKPVHTSPAAGKNFSDDPVRIPGIDIPPLLAGNRLLREVRKVFSGWRGILSCLFKRKEYASTAKVWTRWPDRCKPSVYKDEHAVFSLFALTSALPDPSAFPWPGSRQGNSA